MIKQDIINLLSSNSPALFATANDAKQQHVGNTIFLRGLIEYSNICSKNCYYCGLRCLNNNLTRYTLTDEEVLQAAEFAWQNGFGSVVIQAGELQSNSFTNKITTLLNKISQRTQAELGITLSLGEQSKETLAQWRQAGATRYLLRIETSNPKLYASLHPNDNNHSHSNRLQTLETLKQLNYQVGTGIMIGLPGQTLADLADDILFMKHIDIDMIGMGPFVGHSATPLFNKPESFSLPDKVLLTLKITAILRILMQDINIAATTALQTLDSNGRAKAIEAGANVIMPNITPKVYRNNYLLYENKPITNDVIGDNINDIAAWAKSINAQIGLHKQGNSLHYSHRQADMSALRF